MYKFIKKYFKKSTGQELGESEVYCPIRKNIGLFWQVSFHMKKISTDVDNNQLQTGFSDTKWDLSKETYKMLRIGQYTSLSPIACPILLLETLLCIYIFIICLFL